MDKITKQKFNKLKLCFVLGIQHRSGTNYLFRSLRLHPHCIGPGPIWEDFILHESDLLKKFIKSLYSNYPPRWKVEETVCTQEKLLELFGSALCQYLQLQIPPYLSELSESLEGYSDGDEKKILLTKTPSVKGIDDIFKIFPDAYLLIIVRDGRSVVESGVKSFNWKYEVAMRNWASSAKTILEFLEKHSIEKEKVLMLKYEELFGDSQSELSKVIQFLELDKEIYDFEAAENLNITGSSEIRKNGSGKMHWNQVKKTSDFKPEKRFSNWDKRKHERFNWIAGKYMLKFGYSLKPVETNEILYFIKNKILDIQYDLKIKTLSSLRLFKEILKLFLKKNG